MNYIVCSVTLMFLCLGNVAGFIGKIPQEPATPVAHHPTENIEHFDSSVRNWNFTCVSKHHRDHQWFHVYPNGNLQPPTYIGNIPTQTKVKTTQFNIKLEAFDNNTEIHCDNGRKEEVKMIVRVFHYFCEKVSSFLNFEPAYHSYNYLIQIGTNELLKDNEKLDVLKYNETQKVSFKCQEYINKTNLVIGVINTISNMIVTYNKTFLDQIFNKWQNGTVLCCMYYEVIRIAHERWITRHVAKKTLLVYEEPVTVPVTDRQDSSEEKGEDDKNPDADLGNQDADSSKQNADSGKQDPDSSKQFSDPSNEDPGSIIEATIIYTVSAVAVVFVLLAVSVIYLKRCRKKPKVEVEAKVLYADLDFLRRNEPESLPKEGPQEESPYAQIIGELRPQ